MLNPIMFAIATKNLAALKELVGFLGLRQSMGETDIIVKFNNQEFAFTNLVLPLALKAKDNEILSFLL